MEPIDETKLGKAIGQAMAEANSAMTAEIKSMFGNLASCGSAMGSPLLIEIKPDEMRTLLRTRADEIRVETSKIEGAVSKPVTQWTGEERRLLSRHMSCGHRGPMMDREHEFEDQVAERIAEGRRMANHLDFVAAHVPDGQAIRMMPQELDRTLFRSDRGSYMMVA